MSEFKLPDVGEGLTEAEIVTWRVAVGDTVEVNDIARRHRDRQVDRRAAQPVRRACHGAAGRGGQDRPGRHPDHRHRRPRGG